MLKISCNLTLMLRIDTNSRIWRRTFGDRASVRASQIVNVGASSDAYLAKAWSWLKSCQTNHPRCDRNNVGGEPPSLPPRVIDVTPLDQDGSVRLLDSSNMNGIYNCLSHCWGSAGLPLVTKRENIASHKINILWATIPQTFKVCSHYSIQLMFGRLIYSGRH